MIRILCLFSLLIILANCGEEEEAFVPQYQIETEALPYVRSFFIEARKRGLTPDSTNLILQFSNNLTTRNGDPICGNALGVLTDDQQNIITIDPECLAWRHSDLSREILVFHELGHVFLERTHEDNVMPNGDFKSIMFGGNWNIFRYYTEDLTKKDYYLNELFDPSTPIPDWAN